MPKAPDMTRIVCGSTKVAGLAGWHASCPTCDYESASSSVAINAHSVPAVDEAEREAGLKALRLENFRTIVAWARQHAGASGPRLFDVGSAMVGSSKWRASSSTSAARWRPAMRAWTKAAS